MEQEFYKFDGVLWTGNITPNPYCPKHRLEMDPYTYDEHEPYKFDHLRCEECSKDYVIPRDIDEEQKYIARKLKARTMRNFRILNLDDEAIPLAEEKVSSKNGKYFVTALLTKSKIGHRLVVYAGVKGNKKKTQIFVEPEIKRLAFDQKDLHPTEVFVKLEGTFDDGSSSFIFKKKNTRKKP
jgi:hypothetical protein